MLDLLDELLELARSRLRFGADARERDLLEVVRVCEVREGRVARDDLPPLARGEAVGEVTVEHREPCDEGIRSLRCAQRLGDVADDIGEAAGVEPDVRVAAREERHGSEDVDGVLTAGDRIFQGRHEATADVEDTVRVPEPGDVAGRELEVVRLGAGWSQIANVCVRRDVLRCEREGIEGGDDPPPLRRFVASTAASCDQRRERDK